ncbi:MAG: bifunctional O-acetylhomoserine aminocarboxypropyltransferase/cysteine synthase [Epsilonproteobacteria bacterium]|nr:MAG: bifunctional O-acetylhomoserine aminocarboxypropyltransferase/cysteine synthase [Campylobacterota bacterium]
MKKQSLSIHEGYEKDNQKTMAPPIYLSTAYEFDSTQHAADLFALKQLGNIYTRLMNPTNAVFEKRLASLEGGTACISTSSGMAAIFGTIINLCEAGDNIIVSSGIYGGTTTLTDHTIKRLGITTKKFDLTKVDSLEKLIDDKTKIILFESLSNPTTVVPDIQTIVNIADKAGVITVVDNTVATPILCNPIKLGCDIVVHSTSKYINGQGTALGGAIIDSKNCAKKLKNNDKYKHFSEPDMSYHGLVYNDLPFPAFATRMVLAILRDIGITASPMNSWLMTNSLETLYLRIKQHSDNALCVAKFLTKCQDVKVVNYPGLENDKNHKFAKKYFCGEYFSGLLSFDVGSLEKAKTIVDNIKLFSIVVNIGDSKSIITHPASTTHQQLSSDELNKAGISEGLIRLSIGLEHIDDLIDALKKVIK